MFTCKVLSKSMPVVSKLETAAAEELIPSVNGALHSDKDTAKVPYYNSQGSSQPAAHAQDDRHLAAKTPGSGRRGLSCFP